MSEAESTIPERIRLIEDALTSAERKAARALLADYPMAGLDTVAGYAERAGVSGPSILRFVSRLGFSGYQDFQQQLRLEMKERLKPPIAKAPQGPDTAQDISEIGGFVEAVTQNIHATQAALVPGEIEKTARLIASASGSVYFTGGRFTDPLARYFAAQLKLLRPGVTHLPGQVDNWRDHLVDMDHRDVLVTYDIRRYQEGIIWFAEAAAARKVPVVLMTDQWVSPVTRVAKHVLPAHVDAPSNFDSVVSIMMLTEALIAACTTQLWPTAEKRIAALEGLREEDG